MPAGQAPLNGSGPQAIWINVYAEGQNWGGNFTQYRAQVVYVSNGYGSWTNATQYWSANFGGNVWSGTFTIPSPGTSNITLLDTTFIAYHDGNGYLNPFYCSATIDTNHSSIGDGSVGVTEPSPARIPKAPVANGAPSVSNLLPTQATLSWPANTNNNGAGIDAYLLRYHTNSNVEVAGYTDVVVNGSTLSHTITGLTPGQQYYAAVYAHNSQGFAPKSATTPFKTPSGFYAWNGGEWRPTEVFVWNGSSWRTGEVFVWNGTAWKAAT